MRFFSNDSRDSADDQAHTDEESERAQAQPAAVPLQRPSSPWAASPGTASDPAPGRDAGRDRDPDHADADFADRGAGERPPFHEPGPQPTAFGAGTVGGAVAASATANPLNDDVSDLSDTTDRRTDAAHGVADDRMVQPGDGVVTDEPDRTEPPHGGTGDAPVAVPFTGTGDAPVTGVRRDDDRDPQVDHRTDEGDRIDLPLKDEGTFADPVVVDDRTGARRDDADPIDLPLEDGGTFADPVVVERNGEARTFADTSTGAAAPTAVGAATVPAAASAAGSASGSDAEPAGARADQLPGGVAAPEVGPLFADTDAHAFRDRWRDVQLRFVDDPKDATDDAAKLVDDAVDALAARLREQKERLAGGTGGDTEQLRVRLCGYRDFLDRLLDL